MTLLDQIRTLAIMYGAARKLSISRVSRLAFGDGMKLSSIVEGSADLTTKRYERTLLWFSSNWPTEISWPDAIPRPKLLSRAE